MMAVWQDLADAVFVAKQTKSSADSVLNAPHQTQVRNRGFSRYRTRKITSIDAGQGERLDFVDAQIKSVGPAEIGQFFQT